MRAAILEKSQQPLSVVNDVECSDPNPTEVVVKVASCGICHSDLTMIDAPGGVALPVVLGHEAAGIVEEVGSAVTRLAKGDKVMLTPLGSCGHCYYCARNEPTLCVETQNFMAGTRTDGSTPLSRVSRRRPWAVTATPSRSLNWRGPRSFWPPSSRRGDMLPHSRAPGAVIPWRGRPSP